MPAGLATGLMQRFKRRAGQFKLATRFQSNRAALPVFQRNQLSFFCDRGHIMPVSKAAEKLTNPCLSFIAHRTEAAFFEQKFFMLSANAPFIFRRLLAFQPVN